MPAERADSGSSIRSFTLNPTRPPGMPRPRPVLQLRGMKSWLVSLLLVAGFRGIASRQMFRKEPENRTSIEGETSFLECEVEGASGLVQWVKDGLLLGPDRNLPGFPRYRISGDQAAGVFDLQVDKVRLEDEGSYHCQVGRSDSSPGLISRTAWLEVLIPPRGPHFQDLAVGEIPTWLAEKEYSLTCEAQDSKPVSSVTIMKEDKVITPAETTVKQGSNQKVFSMLSTISFIAKISDNGKKMRCSAMNQALDEPRITYFIMNVLFPPQKLNIKGYDGQPVKAGTTLELTCISEGGNPMASLHWLKGDTVLSMIWETGMEKGPARSVLSYPVTPDDNRVTLTCVASNQVTVTPLKSDIFLHVVFPPEQVLITGTPEATEGSEVSVSCQASTSNPPVRLQWWAIGMDFNVTEATYPEGTGWSTTSNATFVAQRSVDGTSLVCEAVSEALALATSTSVIISVFYPPERIWIQGPPKGAVFQAGTSVTWSCFASGGNPLANLGWAKGEEPVESALQQTLDRLAISRLTVVTQPSDNQAEYRCTAENPASKGTLSARTWVGVQFPPLSLGIEAPATPVREGENFTLVCRAGESNPAVRIFWVRNGERLRGDRSWMERGIFGGWICVSTLTLLASAHHDGEQVRCQAFTPLLREITNTFHTIRICHAPRFGKDQVGQVEGQERGAVVIPLRVSANPEEVSYTWSRNGKELVTAGPTRHHLKEDGSLEIWNLTRFDAGIYKINVKNNEGENETFVRLVMLYSPRIHSISDPAEVEVGGTVEMVCTVDANPISSKMVYWNWTGSGREVGEEDQIFKGNTTKLVIAGARRSDAARYECTADNGIPPAVSVTARLIVQYKPELQKSAEMGKSAVAGDGTTSALLRCKAEGVPDVEFSWAKDGVTLDPDNPRYQQKTTHEGPLHTGLLTIVNASAAQDFDSYSCTARNPLGVDIFDIQLVRIGPPDPPSELTLVRKTHNSVTLAWNPGFNGGSTQSFRVRYAEWDAQSSLYADVYPPQDTRFTVTGLRPGTRYNFSVYAINVLGPSEYSDLGIPLTVFTSGRGPFPSDTVPTQQPGAGWLSLPLPTLILVIILVTSLLLLNVGILGWILWKMRAESGLAANTGKSTSEGLLEMNDYAEDISDTHLGNAICASTNSEPGSSTYESYYNWCPSPNQPGRWDDRASSPGILRPGTFRETWDSGPSPTLFPNEGIYEDIYEDPPFFSVPSAGFPAPHWPGTSAEAVRYPVTQRGNAGRVQDIPASRFADHPELLGDLV